MIAGAAVLIGVWAVPQWDAYQADLQVSSMRSSPSSSSSTVKGAAQLAEAREYNASLAGESTGSVTPYAEQLNAAHATALGWLEIPAIDLRRTVYHYDNDEVLMSGLGHVEGTSLPVGGSSSHCVVTGHSGMPGAFMFDDLEQLDIGDVFVFWTLGDPYAYRVESIEVVEPNDTQSLVIQRGRDLATLITCTPYGINSHRLLVHGERTEYDPEELAAVRPHPRSNRLIFLASGVSAGIAGLGFLLFLLLSPRTLEFVGIAGAAGAGALMRGEEFTAAGALLKLKPFGRAQATIGGQVIKGTWHRVSNGYSINFAADEIDWNPTSSTTPDGVEMKTTGDVVMNKVKSGYVTDALVNGESAELTFKER